MRIAVFAFGIVVGAAGCNGNTARTDDHVPSVAATTSIAVHPTVAWPAASSVDEAALLSLAHDGSDVRALVSRSVVPVLAPKDLRLASPTLVVEGEYFALTGRVAGATISLQGTRAAHQYDGIEPAAGTREILRGDSRIRGFVSVNENIRTASWMENGVAYSIDVECSDHRDLRCETDDFLLSTAAQLTFVGGSGR